ncbi:MAG: aldehyde dehydrogenase family protein [Flavobacteriales bacterium]|nr:aldehyde dehydrogenase family protein [Flavobacteriales bacterium]
MPTKGFWCRPTLFPSTWRKARASRRRRSSSGARRADLPAPWTRRSRKPTTRPTASAPACGRTRGARSSTSPATSAGVIWANTYNKSDPTSPFGGYKESGYGREGGLHGLSAYLNLN